MGFSVLPSYVPAQLGAIDENAIYYWFCFILNGSKLSEANLCTVNKNLFKPNVYGNVNSLRQRSSTNSNCVFRRFRRAREFENSITSHVKLMMVI